MDVDAVRAYLRVPAAQLPDAELGRILAACRSDQARRCDLPTDDDGAPLDPEDQAWPAALDQALLRRVQREVAARALPLGLVGLDAAEYGPQRLPAFDALIEEHERPFRSVVLA